jgi:hypothetical protein
MSQPIQVKVRSGFNVYIPSNDSKKSAKSINEDETAYVSEAEYKLIAHQVDVIEPTAKGK